jgi:hypothetical protein
VMANGSRAGQPLPFPLSVRLSVAAHQIPPPGLFWAVVPTGRDSQPNLT